MCRTGVRVFRNVGREKTGNTRVVSQRVLAPICVCFLECGQKFTEFNTSLFVVRKEGICLSGLAYFKVSDEYLDKHIPVCDPNVDYEG